MLRNVLLEKSLAILVTALIGLQGSAWAASGDDTIKVYQADDGKYLVLQAAKGGDKFYLLLPGHLFTPENWQAYQQDWKPSSEAFNAYFPWKANDKNLVKQLQSAIGAQPDGGWGRSSWKLFEAKLRLLSEDSPTLDIGEYQFQFAMAKNFSKKFPAYEGEFKDLLREFQDWQNWKKAETKLKKIEPHPIHIAEFNADGSGVSEPIPWLPDIKNDPSFKIEANPDAQKYIKFFTTIENNRIKIQRIVETFPNKSVELQLSVVHKKYDDLKRTIPLTVAGAKSPVVTQPSILSAPQVWLLMIFVAGVAFLVGRWQRAQVLTRMLEEKNISKLPGRLEVQPFTLDELEKQLEKHFGIQNNQISKTIRQSLRQDKDATETLLQIYSLLNETLQRMDLPDYETPISDDSKLEFKALVENMHQGLQSLEVYIGEITNREKDYRERLLLMGKKVLDKAFDPNKYSRKVDQEILINQNLLISDMENQINNYRSNSAKLQNRFKEAIRVINEVFQPMAQDDNFRQLCSFDFWTKTNSDVQQRVIQESSQTFRDMEVTFPQLFKNIESQLQRAGKICEIFLMAFVETLENESTAPQNLKNDVKQLHESLDKALLGEPNNRPEWTKNAPLLASIEDTIKLQDEFWNQVWVNELDRSMQLIQRILFKLKLILNHGNHRSETFFKRIYELEMAAGAILHLLQSVVLACGRLYHDIAPGQKINLDFVSKEGDLNILDDKKLYQEVKNSALQVGDIIDVRYWGVSELRNAFMNTVKSRVIERPGRM